MWKALYDIFLQSMTTSWARFLTENKTVGKSVRDNFQNRIYPEIGLYMIVITFVSCLFFYYYLNLKFGRYYSALSWFIALSVNSVLVGIVTYRVGKKMLGGPPIDVSGHLLWISIINSIYAIGLFFLLSAIMKWKSPMGKRTPI